MAMVMAMAFAIGEDDVRVREPTEVYIVLVENQVIFVIKHYFTPAHTSKLGKVSSIPYSILGCLWLSWGIVSEDSDPMTLYDLKMILSDIIATMSLIQ
jgi:hypothetical protein